MTTHLDVEEDITSMPLENVFVPSENQITIENINYKVGWDGSNDPLIPLNWTQRRKWINTLLDSFASFLNLMASTMLAPAIIEISTYFQLSIEKSQLILSIFQIGWCFGPLIFAPIAELYGRRPIYLIGGFIFFIFNLACGFSKTSNQLVTFRFLASIGASSSFAIGPSGLRDCWPSDQRGKSLSIASTLPLLGPGIGPAIGGLITQHLHWRWLFYMISIFYAVLLIISYFHFKETHNPIILQQKANRINRQMNENRYYPDPDLLPFTYHGNTRIGSLFHIINSLGRPIKMLFSKTHLQIITILGSYPFGILYIVLSQTATMYQTRYNQTISQSSLHYFAQVLGYIFALQIGGIIMDRIWEKLQIENSTENGKPEWRLPLLLPGGICMIFGILLFGWSAEKRLFWFSVDSGMFIFGFGYIILLQTFSAYMIDSYQSKVASAQASIGFIRGMFAFAFPIFAPALFNHLGYGWGCTLLASLLLFTCAPIALALYRFGYHFREKI